jgi:hypothetical protein
VVAISTALRSKRAVMSAWERRKNRASCSRVLTENPLSIRFSGTILCWRNTVSDLHFVSWKEVFVKAVEEKDRNKAAQLLHEADIAIFRREQELDNSPMHREELSAIASAIEALRVMRHVLNAQDKSEAGIPQPKAYNANEKTDK